MGERTGVTTISILIVEALGFGALILLRWVNDPTATFPEVSSSRLEGVPWHHAMADSIAIGIVALLVLFITCRLMARTHPRKNPVVVCAWCRKINLSGEWVGFEEYVLKKARTRCTHGVCTSCAQDFQEESKKLLPKGVTSRTTPLSHQIRVNSL